MASGHSRLKPGGLGHCGLKGCCLRILRGLKLAIDLLQALQERLHGRHDLIEQAGDLLFAIGMINPCAAQRLALIAAQEPLESAVAGLDQQEPPPSGKLSPVLLTMRGLVEMTSASLQRGFQG
jgi:hypothetical protein